LCRAAQSRQEASFKRSMISAPLTSVKARLAAYSFGAPPQHFFGKNGSRKAVNRGSEMHANFEILNHAPFARLALRFVVPTWAVRVHMAARMRSARNPAKRRGGSCRVLAEPSH